MKEPSSRTLPPRRSLLPSGRCPHSAPTRSRSKPSSAGRRRPSPGTGALAHWRISFKFHSNFIYSLLFTFMNIFSFFLSLRFRKRFPVISSCCRSDGIDLMALAPSSTSEYPRSTDQKSAGTEFCAKAWPKGAKACKCNKIKLHQVQTEKQKAKVSNNFRINSE